MPHPNAEGANVRLSALAWIIVQAPPATAKLTQPRSIDVYKRQAYINTFLAAVCQADALAATVEIAPVVEEMMKLLPLVFYLLVFEPEGDKIKAAAITVALAFATFENVCYLIQNGADRFSFIFFRGFGTGAMHVLCGLIVGGGLAYAWQRTWLKIAGTWGLLGAAITLHAVYNLLIAYGGAAQYAAYALPVLLVAAGRLSAFRLSRRK